MPAVEIDLPVLGQILDPSSGNVGDRGIQFTADGAGSFIDLSALTTFQSNDFNDGNSDGSSLTASNGGDLDVPLLTTLSQINLTIVGASVLPISQYTSITDGLITVQGTDRTFTNVTDIDGSPLTATAGGTLSLPNVTSYTYGGDDPVWQASGSGSVLDLSGLTTLTVSTQFDTRITVEALAGGETDLSHLGQILDPSSVNIGDRGACSSRPTAPAASSTSTPDHVPIQQTSTTATPTVRP